MDYRTLTISREYGSGGARVAQILAEWLGWKLLDGALIDAIARAAHVDMSVVQHYDEHVESWLRSLNQQAMRAAALAAGIALNGQNCFDEDMMTALTRQIVEQAYSTGNCVIVGRGAQCILQRQPGVYHVFVYAPFRERLHRLRQRLGSAVNVEHRIQEIDSARAQYLHQRFATKWNDPHLYNLMISSSEDESATARIIFYAMTGRSQTESEHLQSTSG